MARIDFDIKYVNEIVSGKYKPILECGVEALVLSWNIGGEYPIVCMAKKDDGIPFRVNNQGIPMEKDKSRLYIDTSEEIELTEFEEAIGLEIFDEPFSDEEKKVIREEATKILPIARKALQPWIDKELDKAYKNADKVQYERGKEDAIKGLYGGKEDFKEAVSEKIRNMVSKFFSGDGNVTSKEFADEFAWELLALAKAEAYKDLPTWQHMYAGAGGSGDGRNIFLIRDRFGAYSLSPVIACDDDYLVLAELDKLPKK